MKKPLFFATCLLLSLGAMQASQAQVNFIRMGMNAATLAKRANQNKSEAEVISTTTYQGQSFPMLRTPTAELPKKGAEQITALETELDRCHTALLADDKGLICTPEQKSALQAAMRNLAKVKSNNMTFYQQEAAFYLAENTRRQQAAAPAPATN
jgi:hypothetical protein